MADAPAAIASSSSSLQQHRLHTTTEDLMVSNGSSSVAISEYSTLAPRSPRGSSSPEVDFQEAILRANHKFVDRSISINVSQQNIISRVLQEQEEEEEEEDGGILAAKSVLPVAIARSKSESQQGQQRHRSPAPYLRLRSTGVGKDDDGEEDEQVSIKGSSRREGGNMNSMERMKSPRRSRVVAEAGEEQGRNRRTHRVTRRSSKVLDEENEDQDADLGMGDGNRASRSTVSRSHARGQHKRKPVEALPLSVMPPSTSDAAHHPHSSIVPQPRAQWLPHIASSAPPLSPPSRIYATDAVPLPAFDWLQFIGDIIMWRHIPRSALLFGVGCFCIMSASLIQEMKYSVVPAMAYIALLYLATTFIKRAFIQGGAPMNTAQYTYTITEAEALKFIRLLLPPINLMLVKLGELFTGDPSVTLKVAFSLWLLAKAGSMMNLWTLARMAYFAIFTIPKFYSCYSEQMHVQAGSFLHRVWVTWNNCTHKKAVLFLTFVVVWNFSSVSTRIWGAFMALVTVRAYQHVIRREFGIGPNLLNRDIPSVGVNSGVGIQLRRQEVQKRTQ